MWRNSWNWCVRPRTAPRVASRVAIVLFNLGGPDRPEAIKPFLLNLFTDPAILRVPFFVRPILARIIARNRLQPAVANYDILGGRSPLLELTRSQAAALEAELREFDARCFVAMRYWHPLSDEAARVVRDWDPDEVVLLPLYPHHSSTTTGSSFTAWREAAARAGLVADTVALCCYPTDAAYIAATTALLRTAYDAARARLDPTVRLRVLFSAHGLPEVVIRKGDPYQWQIEQTVAGVLGEWGRQELDWVICYQSRATPQRWIEPSTESEIERAAQDGVATLVVPIAFVSDHSETLVELDVDYRALADRLGVRGYFRVPTHNSDAAFIMALAQLVRQARSRGPGLCSHAGGRVCPADRSLCPLEVGR
jgi:protoporphyrin/coproporphyrin ferrochelatase